MNNSSALQFISRFGFIFVRQIFDNGFPEPGRYSAVGIPMSSLVTKSLIGAGPRPRYRGHLYQNQNFTAYFNRNCESIGNYMLFMQYAYMNWTASTLPSPELELYKVSRRRWFNHLRFHR
ncbi:hypothetical protein Y032_0022g573 [Ancylostoma ceylanicum]|uniref:Uncharacterized protein n=1 Tax=Ancylostoma ceylanicum TaxID=53326 RepID=A0A016V0Q3_9BILA|nr:hypothetical protein Y032_0022g573 [Ancylostoma ceylanicum]